MLALCVASIRFINVFVGYVNIYSELAEGKKWVKRFCVVKNNRLDCYKDPLDEYIEFSLALVGAQVDLVDNKSPKKIKIVQDVKEVLLSVRVLFCVDDIAFLM